MKKLSSNVLFFIFLSLSTNLNAINLENVKVSEPFGKNTSLEEAFNYFIQCDIFIMASSAFSHVPALYKKNGLIIYTWSKYFKPLKHWIDSDDINVKKKSIKKFIESNYSDTNIK